MAAWVFPASMHTLSRTVYAWKQTRLLSVGDVCPGETPDSKNSGLRTPKSHTASIFSVISHSSKRAPRPSPVSAIYCSWPAEPEQTQSKMGTWTGKIKAASEKKGGDRLNEVLTVSSCTSHFRAHSAFNKPEQDSGNGPDGLSEASNYNSLIQIK